MVRAMKSVYAAQYLRGCFRGSSCDRPYGGDRGVRGRRDVAEVDSRALGANFRTAEATLPEVGVGGKKVFLNQIACDASFGVAYYCPGAPAKYTLPCVESRGAPAKYTLACRGEMYIRHHC